MQWLRSHWYQLGLAFAIILLGILVFWHGALSDFRILLCISLMTLFFHQFEEYQFPGYFPRMINTVLFKSETPDHYPLNANTALLINTIVGWGLYTLAIIFGEHAVWLAVISVMISAGNVIAHTFLFNIKGKTFYNPGMATALLLFLPLVIYFFVFTSTHHLIGPWTLTLSIILGALLNYFGVLKPITLFSRENSPFVFQPFR
ncbi:MAG TPA: HXXEE domain-containing protein [Candidatus Paceibacterota bacterium]|nr:HXXEE domain-containing protein [Candidatus Paceibacterota bacterium]